MTNTSHSSNPTNSGGSKNKKKFNQKTHKHQDGNGNERRKPGFKGLAQDGAMKGVVITQERSLAGQIKQTIHWCRDQPVISTRSLNDLRLHQEQEGSGGQWWTICRKTTRYNQMEDQSKGHI